MKTASNLDPSPKEYYHVEHRPTHLLEFRNMDEADIAESTFAWH